MPIVIASNNLKKSQELENILIAENVPTISQAHLQIASVAETGLTFVENAILKARNACKYSNMPAIGDDSGLEVDALDKQPGIYSSRFAGPTATDDTNIAKLLEKLRDVPESKRQARFQCIMVFLQSATDHTPIICQGTWEGRITIAPIGNNGFGYDPIFWVPDHNCTSAQLSQEIKNKISHRAQALRNLITTIKNIP